MSPWLTTISSWGWKGAEISPYPSESSHNFNTLDIQSFYTHHNLGLGLLTFSFGLWGAPLAWSSGSLRRSSNAIHDGVLLGSGSFKNWLYARSIYPGLLQCISLSHLQLPSLCCSYTRTSQWLDNAVNFKWIRIWLVLHSLRGSSPATSGLCDYVCYFPCTSDFGTEFSFACMVTFNNLPSYEAVRVPFSSYSPTSPTSHWYLGRSAYRDHEI